MGRIILCYLILLGSLNQCMTQIPDPGFHYEVSFDLNQPDTYSVSMQIAEWNSDTMAIKMPAWMPGYYQIMDYGQYVQELTASDENNELDVKQIDKNTWNIFGISGSTIEVNYHIKTKRKFVANSFVDKEHAYLVPGNSFFYIPEYLESPATVKINLPPKWSDVATGLTSLSDEPHLYKAEDFDVLYDCPVLIGNLESLPSFNIQGVPHHFIGYDMGEFEHTLFMEKLKKVVQNSVDIIQDIPFNEYSFIAIGPGRGGIEHLNNSTISFSGNNLDTKERMERMMNFLAHEYFHHYNVKRIRPFELGPFDYDNGSRTNLLWVSEGLTVYYEYLIVKRANLVDDPTFLSFFDGHINIHEEDAGRKYQSLQQSSYNTWSDGPFGNNNQGQDRAISYYNKGPIVGLLLDLEIRNKTGNTKSLDDVMRYLYNHYYKQKSRGFTEAEFQRACEAMAGESLDEIFEYVYTTKEFDYDKYLKYAGLRLVKQKMEKEDGNMKYKYNLQPLKKTNQIQSDIFKSWTGQ